jgi:uncharacterized membrane protein YcaP (DUF421 family)
MKKEDIQPWDWQRILFGEAPPEFLVEVFLRTFIIYVVLMVIVRMMGKRMGGQLTISELAVMVTLGAIVSPAMQIPQLGVIMGIMILVCALIFQRGLNLAEFKNARFESISQGEAQLLIRNGIIQLDQMKKAKISRQQLFSALRSEQVFNLGDVGRVYIETGGSFSIYKKKEPSAGLPVYPPTDASISAYAQQIIADRNVCKNCGKVLTSLEEAGKCEVCGDENWMPATVSINTLTTNS